MKKTWKGEWNDCGIRENSTEQMNIKCIQIQSQIIIYTYLKYISIITQCKSTFELSMKWFQHDSAWATETKEQ